MSYYANSEERAELIAGLRDLADFLDQDPQVPAPRFTDLFVFPPDGSDAEMFAEIDVIAEHDRHHGQRRRQPGRPLQRGPRLRPGAVPRRRHPAQRTPRERKDRIAMLHLILCSVVLVAGALTVGLAVVIIGIHRSEHGKRLTGRPDGLSETLARRLLVGSRGCGSPDDTEGGPR